LPQRFRKNNSGGPNAPRFPNGNIDWTELYNQYLQPILRAQKAPNTVRGLMYVLESKEVLKKSDYNGLDKHLVRWRLDGLVPWDAIADGSGRGLIGDFEDFEDPESWIDGYVDVLRNGPHYYHDLLKKQWRWFGQPNYVTFMAEKHAVTGTINAYAKDRYVKISYNRGNNGWGWAHTYVDLLKKELKYIDIDISNIKPRNVYIWYLGDDDKYGRHMDRELRGQLDEFGISKTVYFERIAVLPEQVREYGIPRADEGGGYEIDALNAFRPDLFERLLLDHIDPYFDNDIHKEVLKMFSQKNINKMINDRVNFTN
jgi:hypothetical protein